MATYSKVDNQRELEKKAAMYDQLVQESKANDAARAGAIQGLQFGRNEGYQAGMVDNNATSNAAYAKGRQDEQYANTPLTMDNGQVVSDPDGANYPGYVPESQQDLQQYAAQVDQAVQQGQMDPAKGKELVMIAQDNLAQVMAGQQGGTSGLGSVNQGLTQQAAQMSMQ